MATYYAWAKIVGGEKEVALGEEVSRNSLGLEKDEWEALKTSGAVRTTEYPDMGDFGGSPVEFRKAQLAAAASGTYFGENDLPEVDPETGRPLGQ